MLTAQSQSQFQPQARQDQQFQDLSEYRKFTTDSLRYRYSQFGHIFAPNPHWTEGEKERRSLLDDYMRLLTLMPLGAAILQLEIQAGNDIEQAQRDGELHRLKGVWAYRVQTETFSYYTLEADTRGQKEWLDFFSGETYETRNGNIREKLNLKAVNLAFKKPLEGGVVNEVEARFQHWFKSVLDMFRRHWEARDTVEGRMVLNLFYEYASSVPKIIRAHPGEENQDARIERIQDVMDQFMADIEEVRQTAKTRVYTDQEIIQAARRCIHNFCVDQNRRLLQLLGVKRKVNMFIDGQLRLVYKTNVDPNNWRSRMLNPQELVDEASRAFLMLAQSDLQRSKQRMDEKARETYAPVAHADTRRGQEEVRQRHAETSANLCEDLIDLMNGEAEDRSTDLPFGMTFGSEADGHDDEPEIENLPGMSVVQDASFVDALATKGQVKPEFVGMDLRTAPYVGLNVKGNQVSVVHRWGSALESAKAFRNVATSLKDDVEKQTALKASMKIVYDPQGQLGAEGSSLLLRSLDPQFKRQIGGQGDRYWCPWSIARISKGSTTESDDLLSVMSRYDNPQEAALNFRQILVSHQQRLDKAFEAAADSLKLIYDPAGELPASGVRRALKGLPEALEQQIAVAHYRISCKAVIVVLDHLPLKSAVADQIRTALGAAVMTAMKQAKTEKAEPDYARVAPIQGF